MTRKEGIEMIRRCYRHNEECYVAEEKVGAERAQSGVCDETGMWSGRRIQNIMSTKGG